MGRSEGALFVLALGVLAVLGCAKSTANEAPCDADAGECPDAALPPECEPGTHEPCYEGFPATAGVGPCHGGVRTCSDQGRWGFCDGQVLPVGEICGNGIDENCSGEADEDTDFDGDGVSTCDGDCCDSVANCFNPAGIGPGSFEVPDNAVDDDCDGVVDNVAPDCDASLASGSSDAMDYARAIDLCKTTTEESAAWGVIEATLALADGTGSPAAVSRSIRTQFGGASVRAGTSMAVLSTGHAAAEGQTSPAFAPFQVGVATGTSSPVPAAWLAANGGAFPNATGCPVSPSTDANDPVMLELRVRVPSNASAFGVNANFLSAEYPEWVCSPFNDMFVVLLDTSYAGDEPNPADGNLAIYEAPDGSVYPVGVNLAFGDTGLFRQCENGDTGCAGVAVDGATTTCQAIDELTGTGFDDVKPPSPLGPGTPGWCGQNDLAGGGSGWLEMRGNVVPGEVITLRFIIWDTGDEALDSLVLLDNFYWLEAPAQDTGVVVE